MESLYMARVSIAERIKVGSHVRGEVERHDGAIRCVEVGIAIGELTIGGNFNLRGASTNNRRDDSEQNATTNIDVSRVARRDCIGSAATGGHPRRLRIGLSRRRGGGLGPRLKVGRGRRLRVGLSRRLGVGISRRLGVVLGRRQGIGLSQRLGVAHGRRVGVVLGR